MMTKMKITAVGGIVVALLLVVYALTQAQTAEMPTSAALPATRPTAAEATEAAEAAAIPRYADTIEEAQQLIAKGDYDGAIAKIEQYKQLNPYRTNKTYVDLLLVQAESGKLWTTMPQAAIDTVNTRLADAHSPEERVQVLRSLVGPEQDVYVALHAASLLKKQNDQASIEALVAARAACNAAAVKQSDVTYEESDLLRALDSLFIRDTESTQYLTNCWDRLKFTPATISVDITTSALIAKTASPVALQHLLKVARDPSRSQEARKMAVWVVGNMNTDEAAVELGRFIREGIANDTDSAVLNDAAVALGYTGSKQALSVVEELLPRTSDTKLRYRLLLAGVKSFIINKGDLARGGDYQRWKTLLDAHRSEFANQREYARK